MAQQCQLIVMLRIVVICTANICRSPMARLILQETLSGFNVQVDSAGVQAQHGLGADDTVTSMLNERGLHGIDQHRSKPLLSGMLPQYDLFLCMERHHLEEVLSMDSHITGRAYLFGHWTDTEISDPHLSTDERYQDALTLIQRAAQSWKDMLPLLGLV